MKKAVVRLGRIYAREGPGDIPAGLLRYGRGGMKLAPWLETVPLLQDHHEGKRVGTVTDFATFNFADGDWLCARTEIYPDVDWVKKGVPASFKCALLNQSSFVDGYMYGGIVTEVSLLREEKPAEPGARVVLLYEPEPVRARAQRQQPDELDPKQLRYIEERRQQRILVRPNIGQVLGVR